MSQDTDPAEAGNRATTPTYAESEEADGSYAWLRTAFRRVAYDFHIPDSKADFLSALDPERTAAVLAEAGVQMLQLCAKSHWGLSLYPTKIGKQHPLLDGRDYFGEVVDALNDHGVKSMAYFSDYWDNYAGTVHPEWRQRTAAQAAGQEPLSTDWWLTMCPSSEYRSYLLGQIMEVVQRYPVAGIFTDMTGFRGYCYCDACRDRFRASTGLDLPDREDWRSEPWRRFIEWRYLETESCMAERMRAIKKARPDLVFSHNYHGFLYHYYALSHEPVRAHRYSDYVTIETAPFDIESRRVFGVHRGFGLRGGSQAAKFARDVARGKPFEAVGARCATGHDFTEKALPQMMLEAYSVVAHGCPYTIIESAGMDGAPIEKAWGDIGVVFDRIKAIEPWLLDSTPLRYVGLVFSRATADFRNTQDKHMAVEEFNGFYKACVEAHLPVGVVFDQDLASSEEFKQFSVLVLPDTAVLTDEQAVAIERYVRDGGGLVATHEASLYDRNGARRGNFALADLLGVDAAGEVSDAVTWLRGGKGGEANGSPGLELGRAASASAWSLYRVPPTYVPVRSRTDSEVVASRWAPPFERPEGLEHSSHFEPPYKATGEPLVTVHQYGKGRCAYLSPRAGASYLREGQHQVRELLVELITWAAGCPPPITTTAPMAVEVVANEQRAFDRYVLHLLNYTTRAPLPGGVVDFPPSELPVAGASWTAYDEIVQIAGFEIVLRTGRRPQRVYALPGGQDMAWSYDDRGARFAVETLADVAGVCVQC